jgi:hypothetical protein
VARRVGDVPVVISSQGTTRILLRGSIYHTEREPGPKPKKGAHEDGTKVFGVVYVNEVARGAMLSGRIKFPVGSIIVRERLAQADDAQPQLLSVMYKRAPGFNPKAGDWEFLIVDGALTKIEERQKKGSCLSCHVEQRAHDFVFPLKQTK